MAPKPEKVEVAIGALRDAGNEWQDQSEKLGDASSATGDLQLSHLEMGPAAPIRGVYEEVRSELQKILQEASNEADDIGEALAGAADQYEQDEEDNVHEAEQVW